MSLLLAMAAMQDNSGIREINRTDEIPRQILARKFLSYPPLAPQNGAGSQNKSRVLFPWMGRLFARGSEGYDGTTAKEACVVHYRHKGQSDR